MNTLAQISPVSDATRNSSVQLEAQRSKSIGGSDDVQEAPRTPGADPGTVKNFLKLFQGAGKVPCPQSNIQPRTPSFARVKESETAVLGKSWKSEVSIQSGEAAVNKSVLSRYAPNSDKSFTSPVKDDTQTSVTPSTPTSCVKPSQEDQ